MPPDLPTRARSLQRHGKPAQDVAAGQRCAVNVQGLEVADIERGFVLARPGELFPSSRWMVRLTCLASAPRALRQRVEIHFHHGTRECPARVVFRDRDKLAPAKRPWPNCASKNRWRVSLATTAYCARVRPCAPWRAVRW